MSCKRNCKTCYWNMEMIVRHKFPKFVCTNPKAEWKICKLDGSGYYSLWRKDRG